MRARRGPLNQDLISTTLQLQANSKHRRLSGERARGETLTAALIRVLVTDAEVGMVFGLG